jgi:hypothetical protein
MILTFILSCLGGALGALGALLLTFCLMDYKKYNVLKVEELNTLLNLIMDLYKDSDEIIIERFLFKNGALRTKNGNYIIPNCYYEMRLTTAFYVALRRFMKINNEPIIIKTS